MPRTSMRIKAAGKKASQRGARGSATAGVKAKEKATPKPVKQGPSKPPKGKEAGARRSERLLKRANPVREEPQQGRVSLPKTPALLFKHQIQTKTENTAGASSSHISQFILSVASQCKHRGGISMAELKQALAARGLDVTKNNRMVNVVTRRRVNNQMLVQTTRNASFRLNTMKVTEMKQVWITVKPPKPKEKPRQIKSVSDSPKKSQRQVKKKTKPRVQSQKSRPKGSKDSRLKDRILPTNCKIEEESKDHNQSHESTSVEYKKAQLCQETSTTGGSEDLHT